MNIHTSIKEAYELCFPEDELGKELNDVTFEQLFNTLDNYESVYDFIGVYDSVIRERLFSMLSVIMDVEYDYIYDQWMLCKVG
jgi:hypothetical protein